MKTILIFAMIFGAGSIIYNNDDKSYQQENYRSNTAIILNQDPNVFHDDFDSSYVWYGNTTFSFKSNHVCNEK